MSIIKEFIVRFGFFITFFSTGICFTQVAMAENLLDYNSVDVSTLQKQYQRQLKPKTPKKVTPRKTAKRTQIQSDVLLQYQRLLANQQNQARKQQQAKKPIKKPARQVQRQIPVRVQKQAAPAPRPAGRPSPRRDAIFEAASIGDVRLIGQLLSQGVNVNQANNERETALHMAAAKGHYSAVIYLINHGANINSRTINNWLPIHHAARFRHAQIAHYLKQKGSQIYAKTSDGLTAVDMARATNDRRMLGVFGAR